jgi:hypothetical protein
MIYEYVEESLGDSCLQPNTDDGFKDRARDSSLPALFGSDRQTVLKWALRAS